MGLNLKAFNMEEKEEEVKLSNKAKLIQEAMENYVFDVTNGSITKERIQKYLDKKLIYYTNVTSVEFSQEFVYDDKKNIVSTRNIVTIEVSPELDKEKMITMMVEWSDDKSLCVNKMSNNLELDNKSWE